MSEEGEDCSKAVERQPEKDEEELDQLLDSALKDFGKPPPRGGHNLQRVESAESSAEQLWNDEFLLEAQKQFEQNMKSWLDQGGENLSNEQFGEQLQKIAEEANKVLSEHSTDPNFSSTIAETLKNLSENTENLQSEIGDDITAMLGGLGLGGPEGAPDILPFMQNMMQSFLSKEFLYPSIKDIVEKYPGWLEEQKDKLSKTEYDNFDKQLKIMNEVCVEFEKETTSDSDDTKKTRFTKILGLMEEMQKLGHPPKDLVGEGSPFTCDENGLPNPLPGLDPSQCCIM